MTKIPQQFSRSKSVITGKENLVDVWELPKLPFTEFFGGYKSNFPTVNQYLLLCPETGVFQLSNIVDSSFLYNSEDYNFRTLTTSKIKSELKFFLSSTSLLRHLSRDIRILEIGGNNTVMAEMLSGHYDKYAICDPILEESANGHIEFWNGQIEDNIERVRDFQPRIIILRHVLEHLKYPVEVLRSIINALGKNVVFFVEVPNFRLTQIRQRLDAVFHQHVNYFDELSIEALVGVLGGDILSMESNLEGSNGGSLVFSFTNFKESRMMGSHIATGGNLRGASSLNRFRTCLELFHKQVELLKQSIDAWGGSVVGFGAGLMLPTLNYHLGGALENLLAIYDDDLLKKGSGYSNLSTRISHASELHDDIQNLIVITSMENQRKIRSRLEDFPKSSIIGFQIN